MEKALVTGGVRHIPQSNEGKSAPEHGANGVFDPVRRVPKDIVGDKYPEVL